jgi:DNA polymerase-1
MRIAAHRSGDENLLRIYTNEEDIYSDFAITAFDLPDKRHKPVGEKWQYPGVDKMEHRYPAKTCILASMYRVTGGGLLAQMPVICATCKLPATKHTCSKFTPMWTEEKCDALIAAFYKRYGGLLRMQRMDDSKVRRFAYTWDMWGRLLHVQAVRSVLMWVVSAALREAGNFPIQSGAQGTVKLVMAEVWDILEQGDMLDVCHPLLQLHDELLFECRESVADDIGQITASCFENCVQLDVPIKASVVKANSWGSLEK